MFRMGIELDRLGRRRTEMFVRWAPWGGLLVIFAAAGCVPMSVPKPPVPVAPTPLEPASVARQNDAAVDAALAAAERALAEDRLLTPPDDCAHLHFHRALALAPGLPQAQLGLERVVERYFELANRAIARRNWRSARTMLERAAIVDPAHPGIAPLSRQLELLANAERLTMDLEHTALRARSSALARELAAFGGHARRANARVAIRAGSDADGRWIHQQLRKAPGTAPVRGSIDIGRPPQVTIFIFQADGDES